MSSKKGLAAHHKAAHHKLSSSKSKTPPPQRLSDIARFSDITKSTHSSQFKPENWADQHDYPNRNDEEFGETARQRQYEKYLENQANAEHIAARVQKKDAILTSCADAITAALAESRVTAYLPDCIRKKSNWTRPIPMYNLIDSPYEEKHIVSPDVFLRDLPQLSPKLVALLRKIRALDAADQREHGKLFKHFIFCDVKSGTYGTKMVASGLRAVGMTLANPAPQSRRLKNYMLKEARRGGGGGAAAAAAAAQEGGATKTPIVFGAMDILPDATLRRTHGNNFFLLNSTALFQRPIPVATKKAILAKFNERPDNIYGENARIIVMDSGYKEGIDLFDIKYIHIFEPSTVASDQKQVIGRGTRTCGQRGLAFHPTRGWPLHVFVYDLDIPEKLQPTLGDSKTAFEFYLRALNLDVRQHRFMSEIEDATIEGSVDVDLNRNIHEFRGAAAATGGAKTARVRPECGRGMRCPRGKWCRKSLKKCLPRPPPRVRGRVKSSGDITPPAASIDVSAASSSHHSAPPTTAPSWTNRLVSSSSAATASASEHKKTRTMPSWMDTPEPVPSSAHEILPPPREGMTHKEMRDFIQQYYKQYTWDKLKMENQCGPPPPSRGGGGAQPPLDDVTVAAALMGGASTKTEILKYAPSQDFIRHFFTTASPLKGILLWNSVGTGKCHAKDTPIIMYDGSVKMVQDIVVGDKLMGDDSTPREILSLARGRDEMYDVIPVKGDKYTVNSEHILVLKYSGYLEELLQNNGTIFANENIVEIEVKDFLQLSPHLQNELRGFRKFPTHTETYGISVAPAGQGDYYGFTIDGNNRYLLGDFTVTHNTCAAISAATHTFEREGYTILWVTRTTLKNDIWKNMFQQVCHEQIRHRIAHEGLKIPPDQDARMKLLSKSWKIRPMSYKQFSNLVSKSNKYYEDLVKINGDVDPLRKTLLIIDEAHKLYGGADLSSIERPDMDAFAAAINRSYEISGRDSVRLMLMTATPITTDAMEIIKLINLFKPLGQKLPTEFEPFAAEYLTEGGEFTAHGRVRYLDEIAGYVSYLNRERDARQFAQPHIEQIRVPIANPDEVMKYDRKLQNQLHKDTVGGLKEIVKKTTDQIATEYGKLTKARFTRHLKGACKDAPDPKTKKLCDKIAGREAGELVARLKVEVMEAKARIKEVREAIRQHAEEKRQTIIRMKALKTQGEGLVDYQFLSMYNELRGKCVKQLSNEAALEHYLEDTPEVAEINAKLAQYNKYMEDLVAELRESVESYKAAQEEMKKQIRGAANSTERDRIRTTMKNHSRQYHIEYKKLREKNTDEKSRIKKDISEYTKDKKEFIQIVKKNMKTQLSKYKRQKTALHRISKKIREGFEKKLDKDDVSMDALTEKVANMVSDAKTRVKEEVGGAIEEARLVAEAKAAEKAKKAAEKEAVKAAKAAEKAAEKAAKTEAKAAEKAAKIAQKAAEKAAKAAAAQTKKAERAAVAAARKTQKKRGT